MCETKPVTVMIITRSVTLVIMTRWRWCQQCTLKQENMPYVNQIVNLNSVPMSTWHFPLFQRMEAWLS